MTDSTIDPPLNACEKEPLANSGLIQDAGVLLHVDRGSGLINFVSENTAAFLGDAPEALIGQDGRIWIADFLPDVSVLPAVAGRRQLLLRGLDLGLGELDVLISATATGWLIELEPAVASPVDPSGVCLKPVAEPIDAAALATVQQDLVERIAEASGYGRVMLYEFKADWSGEVVAEKATRVAGTYLGLRFPATDIPAIARALYAQLPYRHIPDVNRAPITILGSSTQGTALDLTWSDLRSVSPVHLEYLRNMQVAAAFSVSVMVEGKLWGLVACHHTEPLKVPVAARLRCHEMVAEFVTALLSHRQQSRDERLARLDDSIARVVRDLDTGADIAATLEGSLANLARLLDAESGVIVVGDQTAYSSAGVTPEMHRAVHDWSVANQLASVAAYERLPDALCDLSRAENGSLCGMLSISVRARRHKNRLVGLYFFRHEESMEIAWAGNPEKRMDATEESVRLAPRLSFDKWIEVRTGYSRPWDPLTMFTATQLQRRLEAIL